MNFQYKKAKYRILEQNCDTFLTHLFHFYFQFNTLDGDNDVTCAAARRRR